MSVWLRTARYFLKCYLVNMPWFVTESVKKHISIYLRNSCTLYICLVGLPWHAIQTYFLFKRTVQVQRHKECDYSVSVFPLILLSNYLSFLADNLWGRRLVCSMVFSPLYGISQPTRLFILLVNTTVCCAVCHPHPLLYNTQTNRHEPRNEFLLLLTLLTLAMVAIDLWILNTERDVCCFP